MWHHEGLWNLGKDPGRNFYWSGILTGGRETALYNSLNIIQWQTAAWGCLRIYSKFALHLIMSGDLATIHTVIDVHMGFIFNMAYESKGNLKSMYLREYVCKRKWKLSWKERKQKDTENLLLISSQVAIQNYLIRLYIFYWSNYQ